MTSSCKWPIRFTIERQKYIKCLEQPEPAEIQLSSHFVEGNSRASLQLLLQMVS